MPLMPPMNADERELLLIFLRQQRSQARNAAHGLTDAQAAAAPSASGLSVGGLIKHLTAGERGWMQDVRRETGPVSEATEATYLNGFRMMAGDTIEELLADYDAACAETDATIHAIEDLNQAVPVPAGGSWLPSDLDAWSVRWVLLHLIEETARHAGHADVIRETIDGAMAGNLMAAAEGWPADGWITPWTLPVALPDAVPA
jgi:hypothetical protein